MLARTLFLVAAFSTLIAADQCGWQIAIKWEAELTGASDWPPLMQRDRIYTVHSGVGVSCVNRNTGDVTWSFNDADVVGGCTFALNKIFVPKKNGIVSVNANTGAVAYRFTEVDGTPSQYGAPLAIGGHIVFGTDTGIVYALSASNLRLVWKTDLGMLEAVLSSPQVWREHIVIGTMNGNIWLLNKADGTIVSSYTTPGVGPNEGIHTSILIDHDKAYYAVSSSSFDFVALDLTTMTQMWAVSLSQDFYAYTSPTIDYMDIIYTTSYNGKLFGLNAADGTTVFEHDVSQTLKTRGPLARTGDDLLVVAASSGTLIGYDIDSNGRGFSMRYGGEASSNPLVVGNSIYLATTELLFETETNCIQQQH